MSIRSVFQGLGASSPSQPCASATHCLALQAPPDMARSQVGSEAAGRPPGGRPGNPGPNPPAGPG
eukprot:3160687-Alexandrium_andersonii.AAC.1